MPGRVPSPGTLARPSPATNSPRMEAARRKQLEDTTRWDPAAVEGAIFEGWMEGGHFHPPAEGSRGGELLDRDPAAERHRRPAHGARAQRDGAGRARPDAADAGPQHPLAARHRPRRRSPPRPWSRRSCRPRGRHATSSGPRRSSSASGSGASSTARRSSSSTSAWAPPATTSASASPSTRATSRRSTRSSVRSYEQGLHLPRQLHGQLGPGSRSAISDLEVVNREVTDTLYSIDYPVEDGDEVLTVATVRPETMLADTAVAVNPDDERYRELVGQATRSCRWSAGGCRSSPTTTSTPSSAPAR